MKMYMCVCVCVCVCACVCVCEYAIPVDWQSSKGTDYNSYMSESAAVCSTHTHTHRDCKVQWLKDI